MKFRLKKRITAFSSPVPDKDGVGPNLWRMFESAFLQSDLQAETERIQRDTL